MKRFYCLICGKYGKFKNPKISYIFEKTLVFSIIYSKCENEVEQIIREGKTIEILKILGLCKIIIALKLWLKKTWPKNLDKEK